jgi:hypothetical protein
MIQQAFPPPSKVRMSLLLLRFFSMARFADRRARARVREVSACFRVLAVTHHLAALVAAAPPAGVAGDGDGSALVNTFPSFFSVRFRIGRQSLSLMVRGKSDVFFLSKLEFGEKARID